LRNPRPRVTSTYREYDLMADEAPSEGLFQRTVQRFRKAWRASLHGSGVSGDALEPGLPDRDADRVRDQMRACLEGRGGEVSARARAAELGRAYLSLDNVGRERFLKILAIEFDTDRESISAAVATLDEFDDWAGRKNSERRLRAALEPPRRRLLMQFNELPDGVKFLVDMRAELLELGNSDAEMAGLENDLKELLSSWFDIGFLELRQIAWDSPASVLEKLIAYEAVHEIRSWGDMKNRLASDRRCYAYFHPRMPDEPLIFVEIALTDGVADNIQTLLDEMAPVVDAADADTAIFYSISNAQRGLAGISFGGFLIKRVVDQLTTEFDGLKNFATLSPVPGFRRWLDRESRAAAEQDRDLLTESERETLAALVPEAAASVSLPAFIALPDWQNGGELADALKAPLMRLCARYLVEAKRADGHALDPVAHFHLSNGARMERLNWLADISEKGLAQSAGMMINYHYRLKKIEANHEAYTGEGSIPASSMVRGLLKG
jgi:malonyl-CoA decarboxylase